MHVLLDELERRFAHMFAALAAGDDLPPTARLRAEGMMEAASIAEIASEAEVSTLMQQCYRAAFGCGVEDDFGADWAEYFSFPQIPAMAKRAPVYPSTSE